MTEPAGRVLQFTSASIAGGGTTPVITRVEAKIPIAPNYNTYATVKTIDIAYLATGGSGGICASQTVTYSGESAPAVYNYQVMTGAAGGGLGPGFGPQLTGLAMTRADDPHVDGNMTVIAYAYQPGPCPGGSISCPAPRVPCIYFSGLGAIAEERNGLNNMMVSRLTFICNNATPGKGTRIETKGSGNYQRTFKYGTGTGPDGLPIGDIMSELASRTDFTNVVSEKFGFDYTNLAPGLVRSLRFYDFNSNKTAVGQDGFLLPVLVTHPDGSTHTFSYAPLPGTPNRDTTLIPNPNLFWLFTKTDELGFVTNYNRDFQLRITRIDYPGGNSETIRYDEDLTVGQTTPNGVLRQPGQRFNLVTSQVMPSGTTNFSRYDANGLKTESWNSAYPTEITYFTYYPVVLNDFSSGRIKDIKTPLSIAKGAPYATRFEYNGRGLVSKIHYPSTGQSADPTVSYTYDNYGNCTSITDELGHTKTFTYDDYRRCLTYTEPLNAPDWRGQGNVPSRTWQWIYDRAYGANGYPASSHTGTQWRIQFEPAFNGAGDRKMTVQFFDNNDRVWAVQTGWVLSAAGAWTFGADGETHYFAYDNQGNKISYTDPLGRPNAYGFDNRNRQITVTDPLNQTTTTTYDYSNNKTRVTFPDTKFQQWLSFDAFGQAATFIDERSNTTNLTFQWGPMKKAASVTTHRDKDAGGTEDQLTTFSYDGLGNPYLINFPNGTYEQTLFQYGLVSSYRNRKGDSKSLTYDARGRETLHAWSDGGVTPSISRGWDDANRLTAISNLYSIIDYKLDDAGQVWWEGSNVTGSGGRLQTTYYRYPDGSVGHLLYPDNVFSARHDYTARGQLKIVGTDNASSSWLVQYAAYTYMADGKPNVLTHGNGLATTYTYDNKGNLQSLNVAAGSTSRLYRYYWRDNRDRIYAWVKGTVAGNAQENGRGDRYIYDAEGQLTDAYYDAQVPNGVYNAWTREDHFVLDQLGNRKSNDWLASISGWYAWTRRDNGLNQINTWAGGRPANWDDQWSIPNGNLIQDGFFSAWYNALNQPIWYQGPTTPGGSKGYLGYDPLGRCVKRWVGPSGAATSNPATYLYYDGWNLIQEGGSTIATRQYVHGARVDEILVQRDLVGGTTYYAHYDARTHCIALTSSANPGVLVEQYTYDAFGKTYVCTAAGALLNSGSTPAISPVGNRFLFTGREWLSDWGVYDYRHRHYHPELGRFLQPDPKHFGAGDYNLYRYCHNDPINKVDPIGLIDIYISALMNQLGINASLAARQESLRMRDGNDRSQLIQAKRGDDGHLGKPSLQNGFNVGKLEKTTTFESGRLKTLYRQNEFAKPDAGWVEVGAGHVHMDVTGQPFRHSPSMSRDDEAAAKAGYVIYMVRESDPNRIYRLTPQRDGSKAKLYEFVITPLRDDQPLSTRGQWTIVR